MYVTPCHLLNIVTVSWITAVTSQIPSPIEPGRRLHVSIPRDDVQGTPVVSRQTADTPIIIDLNGVDQRWNSSVLKVLLKRGHIRATDRHVTLREEMTTPCQARVYVSTHGRHTEGSKITRTVRKVSSGKSRLTKLHIHIHTYDTLHTGCDITGNDTHISLTCINTTLINFVNRTIEEAGLVCISNYSYISFTCPDTNVLMENSSVCDVGECCISFKLATNESTSINIFCWKEIPGHICVHKKKMSNTTDTTRRPRFYRKGWRKRKRRVLEGSYVTFDPEADFNTSTDHVTAETFVIDDKDASRTKHAGQNNSFRQNPETSRTAMTASLALLGVALVMITVALSIIFKPEEEEEEPEKEDEATEKLLMKGGD